MEKLMDTVVLMLEGSEVTLEIFCVTLVLALPLGILAALGRLSPLSPLSRFMEFYIWLMRGTPLMLQLLFVYFALPMVGILLPDIAAALLAFTLNYAAYFAEIYRGGILSIDRGQTEAAVALGMPKGMCFLRIILPQVVKRVIPAVGNEVITLVKDTSLAFTIAVAEMFTIAKQLSSANTTMVPLIAAGVFYYVFNFIVAWTMERIEKRLSYYE